MTSEPIRLLVCGPRDYTIAGEVWKAMSDVTNALTVGPPAVLINGGGRGVDETAREWADCWNVSIERYDADWEAHGRSAGPRRNQQMIDEGKPNIVLAIQYKGRKTPGTQDMIRRAQKAGIRTEIVEVSP